ncbi:MAG: hypothetical protein Q9165_003791 [Trypethelium subeluteriae]
MPLYVGHKDDTDEHEADAAEGAVLLVYWLVGNTPVLVDHMDVDPTEIVELDKDPDETPYPLENEAGLKDDDPKVVDTTVEVTIEKVPEVLESKIHPFGRLSGIEGGLQVAISWTSTAKVGEGNATRLIVTRGKTVREPVYWHVPKIASTMVVVALDDPIPAEFVEKLVEEDDELAGGNDGLPEDEMEEGESTELADDEVAKDDSIELVPPSTEE